jgi:hypothetical protein
MFEASWKLFLVSQVDGPKTLIAVLVKLTLIFEPVSVKCWHVLIIKWWCQRHWRFVIERAKSVIFIVIPVARILYFPVRKEEYTITLGLSLFDFSLIITTVLSGKPTKPLFIARLLVKNAVIFKYNIDWRIIVWFGCAIALTQLECVLRFYLLLAQMIKSEKLMLIALLFNGLVNNGSLYRATGILLRLLLSRYLQFSIYIFDRL